MTRPVPELVDLARRRPTAVTGDEDSFLASALEHRMLGVVSSAVRRGDLELSDDAATRVAMLDLKERHRHQRFWDAAVDVQRRLDDVGAEAAVLKGIATEARWYDEMGERLCTDIDLLLAPHRLARVADVIGAVDPGRGNTDQIHQLANRGLLQHVDLRLDDDTQIDLHFDPFKVGVPTRSLSDIWTRTSLLTTEYGAIRVLAPEDELVLLLLHLNKDAFSMLGAMIDVRNILERATIDWELLSATVRHEGLEVLVWSSLATVVRALDMSVRVPPIGGLRAATWRRLWGEGLDGYEGRQAAPRRQRLMAMHVRRRRRDIVRELRRQLLPQRGLLEVAGRLQSGEPYRAYLLGRFRRSASGDGGNDD